MAPLNQLSGIVTVFRDFAVSVRIEAECTPGSHAAVLL